MTKGEHDRFYGFTPNMTVEERLRRSKEIIRLAKWNNSLDEDEPDWEGMKGVYPDQDYNTSHLEEYDKATNR